jgi:hypothetical protein
MQARGGHKGYFFLSGTGRHIGTCEQNHASMVQINLVRMHAEFSSKRRTKFVLHCFREDRGQIRFDFLRVSNF